MTIRPHGAGKPGRGRGTAPEDAVGPLFKHDPARDFPAEQEHRIMRHIAAYNATQKKRLTQPPE